ncbi:DUF4254 domain-containing protein [Legionella dresdenensis]|uniref:DUF4254 domain-containing protein n=1 Tax=Legionella dresdenensis TaxID=450200 RepID=A0ABV8CI25_9GAMM
MSVNVPVKTIPSLHQNSIIRWKETGVVLCQVDFLGLVEENHSFNYQLWHAEDRARRDDMGFEFVYQAKREIDRCNQERNNRMEAMDEWLFTRLDPAGAETCPVHSETPGMMIDRLSILALKAYHMDLQVNRQDVDEVHRQNCQRKVKVIQAQQQQLFSCLEELLKQVKAKKRTFRVYHQFKMYNDPNLNPELYLNK